MSEDSFNVFLEYIKKCQLEELDLKDSRVTAQQFLSMLEVLKANKKLRFLNLSYNNLVTASSTPAPFTKNFGNFLEPIAEEGPGAAAGSPQSVLPISGGNLTD